MDTSSDDEYASADDEIQESRETSFATCYTRNSVGSVGTASDFKDCASDLSQPTSPARDGDGTGEIPVSASDSDVKSVVLEFHVGGRVSSGLPDDVPKEKDYSEFGLDASESAVINNLIRRQSQGREEYASLTDVGLLEVPRTDDLFDDLIGQLGGLTLNSNESPQASKVGRVSNASSDDRGELDTTLVVTTSAVPDSSEEKIVAVEDSSLELAEEAQEGLQFDSVQAQQSTSKDETLPSSTEDRPAENVDTAQNQIKEAEDSIEQGETSLGESNTIVEVKEEVPRVVDDETAIQEPPQTEEETFPASCTTTEVKQADSQSSSHADCSENFTEEEPEKPIEVQEKFPANREPAKLAVEEEKVRVSISDDEVEDENLPVETLESEVVRVNGVVGDDPQVSASDVKESETEEHREETSQDDDRVLQQEEKNLTFSADVTNGGEVEPTFEDTASAEAVVVGAVQAEAEVPLTVVADVSNSDFDDIPVAPKGSYNLSLLDDPDFNPFVPVVEQKKILEVKETHKSEEDLSAANDETSTVLACEKREVVPNVRANVDEAIVERSNISVTAEPEPAPETVAVNGTAGQSPELVDSLDEKPVGPRRCATPESQVGELNETTEGARVVTESSSVQHTFTPEIAGEIEEVRGSASVEDLTNAGDSEELASGRLMEETGSPSSRKSVEPEETELDPNGNAEEEIPIKKGGYDLAFLDDPNFNPFVPVTEQVEIVSRKTMTTSTARDVGDDDIPIAPKTGGGYNLDCLDDPDYNPFGGASPKKAARPPAAVGTSPAPTPTPTPPPPSSSSSLPGAGPTAATTDSGVFDELLGSGPPSSSVGNANGAASDAESGASLSGSPQHLASDVEFGVAEDQAELAAAVGCDFQDASSYFMQDPHFVDELAALPVGNQAKVLNRISLFRDFDPLVADEIPTTTRRESYRRFIRESLGGGDLLSFDSGTFSNRSSGNGGDEKPVVKADSRKSALFRNHVLSPKHEVDEDGVVDEEDGDGEDSSSYEKSSLTTHDTVIDTSNVHVVVGGGGGGGGRHGAASVGGAGTPLSSSRRGNTSSSSSGGGSKLAKTQRDELLAEIEKISKERDEALARCGEAVSESDELRTQLGAVAAERDRAVSERDAARAAAADAEAKLSSSSDELKKTKEALDELRIENGKMLSRQAHFKKLVKEYENTMAELLLAKETGGGVAASQLQEVVEERDRLREELLMKIADLKETETAFNSIHAKSERLKETVKIYEANEMKLKEALEEARLGYIEGERVAHKMVEAAQEKLEWAKKELHEANQSKEIEVSGLKGQLKLTQTALSSAQSMVAQKEKEVKELTSIVDELLASMGMSKQK